VSCTCVEAITFEDSHRDAGGRSGGMTYQARTRWSPISKLTSAAVLIVVSLATSACAAHAHRANNASAQPPLTLAATASPTSAPVSISLDPSYAAEQSAAAAYAAAQASAESSQQVAASAAASQTVVAPTVVPVVAAPPVPRATAHAAAPAAPSASPVRATPLLAAPAPTITPVPTSEQDIDQILTFNPIIKTEADCYDASNGWQVETHVSVWFAGALTTGENGNTIFNLAAGETVPTTYTITRVSLGDYILRDLPAPVIVNTPC
jgi:hypothetical protein